MRASSSFPGWQFIKHWGKMGTGARRVRHAAHAGVRFARAASLSATASTTASRSSIRTASSSTSGNNSAGRADLHRQERRHLRGRFGVHRKEGYGQIPAASAASASAAPRTGRFVLHPRPNPTDDKSGGEGVGADTAGNVFGAEDEAAVSGNTRSGNDRPRPSCARAGGGRCRNGGARPLPGSARCRRRGRAAGGDALPHFRLAGVTMRCGGRPDKPILAGFYARAGEGWHGTGSGFRRPIVAGPEKVHFDVQFTRYRRQFGDRPLSLALHRHPAKRGLGHCRAFEFCR